MIPKTIHYVWFGGNPLPRLTEKCLDSWRKHCPDYEIIRWDESRFDVGQNTYCRQAYEAQKWAFVSDFARLQILGAHGGVYLDTDVELLSSLDPFLHHGGFTGFEAADRVGTGLMGCEANQPLFRELLDDYKDRVFLRPTGAMDLMTNVDVVTRHCVLHGLELTGEEQTIAGVVVYPSDYFSPKDWLTGRLRITENSHAIHHYDGSWAGPGTRAKHRLMRALGPSGVRVVKRVLGRN